MSEFQKKKKEFSEFSNFDDFYIFSKTRNFQFIS